MVPIPAAIMKGFLQSTASPRNPLFTPEKTVISTGLAIRADVREHSPV